MSRGGEVRLTVESAVDKNVAGESLRRSNGALWFAGRATQAFGSSLVRLLLPLGATALACSTNRNSGPRARGRAPTARPPDSRARARLAPTWALGAVFSRLGASASEVHSLRVPHSLDPCA